MEYFIYMTNDCNLYCQYCSVLLDCHKTNLPITPTYSCNQLCEFIDRVQRENNDGEANVYFFGGEPTLEYNSIEKLILELSNKLVKSYNIKYILHTNGLLLNKIPNGLLNNLSLIMYSINYEKIPKHGLHNSYFSTIIDNAIAIKQIKDVPMIARLTITENTSLYTEVLQVAPFFDLIYWQIENCNQFKDYQSFYDTYTYEINLTYQYWIKALSNKKLIRLVPFMSMLKFIFFPDRNDMEFSCGYSHKMIYVQTDGKCYACSDSVETGKHAMGDIFSGVKMKKYSLEQFKCSQCEFRRLCMGRCGRMHIEFSKQHINEYCKLNQYMFQLFLKNKDYIESILYPELKDELENSLLEYTEFTP